MELGFDTIGNATVIVYDRGPLLATDPWVDGDAYFGSWTRSHEIPPEQRAAIAAAPYAWVSHGHPDHLSIASLRAMPSATILLADHVGGRIATALREAGFAVRVLPDRQWVPLSDRVRVATAADYNQDSILLVDIDGTLVIDMNDAMHRGSRPFVRAAVRRARVSFLLQQAAFGDADMINVFGEDGARLPTRASRRDPPGPTLAAMAGQVGARFVVPFSSMHQYQRADSVWANEYRTDLGDYAPGFESPSAELLPAYVRYDCETDTVTPLEPPAVPVVVRDPAEFGDDWDEPLQPADRAALDDYVRRVTHLAGRFDFVAFDVGGERHEVALSNPGGRAGVGVTFAVPRAALMTAVRHRVFDDLLIGNFVRTTVHGRADPDVLYPDFTPYVCKYGDNGDARTEAELREYFRAYRARAPFDYLRHRLEHGAADRVRGLLARDSVPYRVGRGVYRRVIAARR